MNHRVFIIYEKYSFQPLMSRFKETDSDQERQKKEKGGKNRNKEKEQNENQSKNQNRRKEKLNKRNKSKKKEIQKTKLIKSRKKSKQKSRMRKSREIILRKKIKKKKSRQKKPIKKPRRKTDPCVSQRTNRKFGRRKNVLEEGWIGFKSLNFFMFLLVKPPDLQEPNELHGSDERRELPADPDATGSQLTRTKRPVKHVCLVLMVLIRLEQQHCSSSCRH